MHFLPFFPFSLVFCYSKLNTINQINFGHASLASSHSFVSHSSNEIKFHPTHLSSSHRQKQKKCRHLLHVLASSVPFSAQLICLKSCLCQHPTCLCVCAHPHLIEHVPPFALRPPHPHQSNSMEIFDLFYILFLSSWFTCSSPSSSTHCPLHRQHLCLFCCLNIGGPSIDVIYIPLPTILLSND